MLLNKNPSGSKDGGNNLSEDHYQDHVTYLSTIAGYAKKHWGKWR